MRWIWPLQLWPSIWSQGDVGHQILELSLWFKFCRLTNESAEMRVPYWNTLILLQQLSYWIYDVAGCSTGKAGSDSWHCLSFLCCLPRSHWPWDVSSLLSDVHPVSYPTYIQSPTRRTSSLLPDVHSVSYPIGNVHFFPGIERSALDVTRPIQCRLLKKYHNTTTAHSVAYLDFTAQCARRRETYGRRVHVNNLVPFKIDILWRLSAYEVDENL